MTEQIVTNDIKAPNKDLAALKIHFPQHFDKDGKFQFDKFQNYLTEKEINFSTESYSLDWLGKSYARLLASDPATTLLKADETHNAKPENANSQNLLIKGDNLEVLKHLTNAYYEQVKMIYIDPPYNTGSDGFVYNDDRKFTVKELQNLIGVDAEKAKRILDFTQSKSNSHSAWLTFMYPRLYIAKQLLKDDGVIFVSIDDNEVAQLRLLMDDVFGEENFVGQWNWFKSATPPNLSKKIKKNIEYILCYEKGNNNDYFKGILKSSKSDDPFTKPQNSIKELCFPAGSINIKSQKVPTTKGIYGTDKYPNELLNDFEVENGKNKTEAVFKNKFIWLQEKLNDEINNGTVINLSENGVLSYKKAEYGEEVPPNLIDKNVNVDTTENAGSDLSELFDNQKVFDYPKPISLLQYLTNMQIDSDDIILDFFAGSGTTGDAVMQLNVEDEGKRKYILVQIPEPIDPKGKKEAYNFVTNELKAEPTIFEITKERLKRAAAKIQKEKQDYKGDLGFKIYETTPIWEDYDFEAESFDSSQTLFDAGKLTEDDLKALLVTWKTFDGISLSQDLKTVDLDGYTAYYGNEKLYLLNKKFNTDHLKAVLEKIDTDKKFNPTSIIAFGYHFESKSLRELAENVKQYANRKKIDIDFITRY